MLANKTTAELTALLARTSGPALRRKIKQILLSRKDQPFLGAKGTQDAWGFVGR